MTAQYTASTLVGLALAIIISGTGMAAHHESDDTIKAHRDMKHEHKKERREMRREHRAQSMLMKVDANKDGKVDLDEYMSHAQERFNKLDADSNGYVTPDEAKESMKKMREEHRERRKEIRAKREEKSR